MSERVTLKVLITVYDSGRAEVTCDGDKVDCDIALTIIKYSFKMANEIAGIVTMVVASRLIDEIVRIASESGEDSKAGVL